MTAITCPKRLALIAKLDRDMMRRGMLAIPIKVWLRTPVEAP